MGDEQAIILSPETITLLKARRTRVVKGEKVGCFLCRRILEALGPKNELRKWPQDGTDEQVPFLVPSQAAHIKLEKGECA